MTMLKKDKVLITGSAGFIGSVLTRMLLADHYQVCVLDNLMYGGSGLLGVWSHPKLEFVRGDIRDVECIGALLTDVDAVVHLAAIAGVPACACNPELARSVNCDASLSLLNECADSGVFRFIFASTCGNYGTAKEAGRFFDENSELKPASLYGQTKATVEQAVLDAATTKDMCATCLRFAAVYGVSPRMRFDLTVNEFTMEMLTRKRLIVSGEQLRRPYMHVADVARAIKLVLELPAEKVDNEVFNVGSIDQNFSNGQLAGMIRQAYVPDAVVESVHADEDPADYRVDFSKICGKAAFEATRTVEEGITEVAQLVDNAVIDDYDSLRHRNAVRAPAGQPCGQRAALCSWSPVL